MVVMVVVVVDLTTCDRCGYEWGYSGDLRTTTCPNCNRKTSTEHLSPDDVLLDPVGGTGECWLCGSGDDIEYHHVNYEDGVVVPLCGPHHRDVHNDEDHPLYPEDDRPLYGGRRNRVRVSDEELASVREAKALMYSEDVVEDVPDGKAIGALADFYINDQGPPPEEVEADG